MPTPPPADDSADDPAEEPGPDEIRAILARTDALGGFFAISTREAEGVDPSWQPLRAFAGAALRRRVDEVDAQLGSGPRVAASLLALSVSARLTALLLAGAAEHGVLLELPHDRLCWRPWSGGPMPLWTTGATARRLGEPDAPATVDALAAELGDTHLAPLVAAVRDQVAVSPRVLWGNAASSLAGAMRVLITERPAVRPAAVALVRGLTERGPLAGLGELVDEPGHPTGIGFVRRTCCLFYRVPGGGTCGDCVLNA